MEEQNLRELLLSATIEDFILVYLKKDSLVRMDWKQRHARHEVTPEISPGHPLCIVSSFEDMPVDKSFEKRGKTLDETSYYMQFLPPYKIGGFLTEKLYPNFDRILLAQHPTWGAVIGKQALIHYNAIDKIKIIK